MTEPKLPLAFIPVDVVALGFTANQVSELESLRQQFTEKIGAQSAHDPAYRQRWVNAQPQLDEELRARIGWEAFNRYQLAVSQAR